MIYIMESGNFLAQHLVRIHFKQDEPRIVIPLVFYHGTQKWRTPLSFHDMFSRSEKERARYLKYVPGVVAYFFGVFEKKLPANRGHAR